MLTLISLLEHVRCRYYSDICLCSTICKEISNQIISRHMVHPYLALLCSAMLRARSLSMGPEM